MSYNQEAKSDAGKIRPTLVPTEIIRAIAKVRECGTSHYSGTVGDLCDTFASLRTEFINKSKPVEF